MIAALLILAFQTVQAQDVRPVEILDLTESAATSPAPATRGRGLIGNSPGGTVEGSVPLALPLQVKIIQREPVRNRLSLGDRLNCDLELANTGDKPFTIPWSQGQVARPVTPEQAASIGYRPATVAVVALDGRGRDYVVGAFLIDSHSSQPSTSRTIQPGETVAIRMSFRLFLQEEGRQAIFGGLAPGTAADVRLAANFSLSPYSYSSGLSVDTIPIKLTAR